jgi:glycosyltransferase involved in cell wall biosynthesis
MKISIAMATYNGSKYIQEQLDSFVTQTRKPDELVVCDDNSTDETVSILNQFAKDAPFEVRVFVNKENLGYSQNFSRSLSLCTGDLVFLSDQDDVWFSNKIQLVENLAKEDKYSQIFMNDAELTYQDLTTTGLTKLGQIRALGMSEDKFWMGCCMAVHKDFLQLLLPIPEQFKGHDVWLVQFGEALQCRKIIPQALQFYRRHESNTSSFIANQTQKAKKKNFLSTVADRIFLVSKNKKIQTLESTIKRADITINFITNLIKTLDIEEKVSLRDKMINFMKLQQQKKSVLIERLEIVRASNMLNRIYYGFKFFRQSKYSEFSGVKTFISDIFP